jgi:hypothetical protein
MKRKSEFKVMARKFGSMREILDTAIFGESVDAEAFTEYMGLEPPVQFNFGTQVAWRVTQ